jgi:cell wall-associated NlpC family hydrolase
MKDKKFKAVNREENYGKVSSPDMQLGRHERFTQNQPQQPSTSRKMKTYQARQPTNDNTAVAADAEMKHIVPEQKEYSDNTENKSDLQMSKSDAVFREENADMQKSVQHKNRIYQQHTQFSAKPADYDFTKGNQTTDYNFDNTSEPYSADTAEQPGNAVDDMTDSVQKPFENNPPKSGRQKKSHKKYYRRQNPHRSKGADFDFSESKNDAEYNFNNETDTRKEPALSRESDEDYNIGEAVEKSDTAFDRVADTDKTETAPTVKRKKNKRLQQKQRLRTDDTVSSKATADIPENEQSDNFQKDYQFKRAKKAQFKSQKARTKADKAEEKLPRKKKIKRQRLFDEEKQKPKNRLKFENEVKPQKDLYHRTPIKSAASAVSVQLASKAHSKVGEVERENSAVEGAHKTERAAEILTQYSTRTANYIRQNRKAAPYKKAARLKFKAEKAEAKAFYEKTLADNPELKKKSAIKKFLKKKQIQKKYQQMKQAEQNAKRAKKTAKTAKDAAVHISEFIRTHKKFLAIVLIIVLLFAWAATTISSCAVMGTSGINSIMTSSYFAEDEDIYMSEGYYAGLEADLQAEIDNIETDYSGYDEYNYSLAQIGHNPYELISYLTAKYEYFTFADIQSELDTLFEQQYTLTLSEETETRTDDEGNEYEYKILNVTLTNTNLNMLANTNLTDDQQELYGIYLETKGNRDYLFADDIYSNEVTPPSYTVPGEALSDSTFRTLITEAEKYLGYPYVWGGSSPSTSFDCSGFVCWVFKNSGVYPLERTTAQGIFNQCSVVSRADAKPGDIIFFTGTYSTNEAVTHVGIYVGDGMMIHCGNPIQYASIESSYWTQHFYAFGRLN